MSQPVSRFEAIRRRLTGLNDEDGKMKTRRMAYWWFRFVVSGRFLEKFMRLPRTGRTYSMQPLFPLRLRGRYERSSLVGYSGSRGLPPPQPSAASGRGGHLT